MKTGKISESILKRSVLKYCKTKREEVVKGAAPGVDCAFFTYPDRQGRGTGGQVPDCQDKVFCAATQTVSLPVIRAGCYAVYAAVNAVAAGGGIPFAMQMALTLPEGTEESELKRIMQLTEEAAGICKVQIAGGHTEVTGAVKYPVISVTAFGYRLEAAERVSRGLPAAGQAVVMTKWMGLEGTAVLAQEREAELLERYPFSITTAAKGFEKYLPVLPEAATALKSGATAMHDMRNGGVFGGLYELAGRLGVGLSIDLKKIPVKQETIEICEFFDLNPYGLLSGGSLLIVAEDGDGMVKALQEAGIPAAVIGRTTDNNDKVLHNGEEIRFLEPARPDEIGKVIA
ncbi:MULTISPECIES: AIR synthase-related protein [Suilimivivens]|jgi:hydrogenase maturation factor|uniref:AIR synthase-related protein n=2 Tax=Suilimivivens TaxID=2981640 RepID=A0ABT2SYR8_9FIRM|nr:AIR synthase-related protein [Suilimivivens aceti]MCU6743148.1 AIR synthase-related protein [Suilimivivens aceti]SCH02727.1 Hydrogenase expression/formation protein hypE [uncultured Clostridium sp.]